MILAKGNSAAQHRGLLLLFFLICKEFNMYLTFSTISWWMKEEALSNEHIHYFLIIKALGIIPW